MKLENAIPWILKHQTKDIRNPTKIAPATLPLAICHVLRQTKVTCNQAYMNLFIFLFILLNSSSTRNRTWNGRLEIICYIRLTIEALVHPLGLEPRTN